MGTRHYKPVIVELEDGGRTRTFEVYMGQPGRPRIYERRRRGQRRIKAGDPLLPRIAEEMRAGVDRRREAEAREARRRRRWWYRMKRWVGRVVGKLTRAVRAWLAGRGREG